MDIESVRAHFLGNYKEPKLTILVDGGLYRHIRIIGDHYYRFDLVTWPGNLAINCEGDRFLFSRTDDMFQFFRLGGSAERPMEPNFSYWAEKLSDPRSRMVRGFSYAKFARDMEEGLSRMPDEKQAEELRQEMSDELYEDDEASCRDFAYRHPELRDLAIENEWKDWTHRYAYACFAIVIGIREYDRAKVTPAIGELAQ